MIDPEFNSRSNSKDPCNPLGVERGLLGLSIDELFHLALTRGFDAAYEPVCELHFRASREVFCKASALTQSDNAQERRLGCRILGQLGQPERVFASESAELITNLLQIEDHLQVLASALVALSYLSNIEAIHAATELKNHWDAGVRRAVAFMLFGNDTKIAVDVLTELSTDRDDGVREWATYGLSEVRDSHTKESLDALRARLSDWRVEIRQDAANGLAAISKK